MAESDRQPAFSPGRAASEDRQLLAALVRDAWQAKQERKAQARGPIVDNRIREQLFPPSEASASGGEVRSNPVGGPAIGHRVSRGDARV